VQLCFQFFLRNSPPYRKEKLSLKTPSPALPLTFRRKELATDSGLGFVSLKTLSPALPLRFRGRELATDSGLGFVSLELPYRGWYKGSTTS